MEEHNRIHVLEHSELPSEEDFIAKAQAFHRLNEASETASVVCVVKFYEDVAGILDAIGYPMAWDAKPTGFDIKYWELSDRFHSFLDKLVFTKDEVNMLGKVRTLISGGRSYDEFHGEMRSGEKTVRCTKLFDEAVAAYRCSTCSSGTVILPLCYHCFIDHGHRDHEYVVDFDYKGSCGCGDPDYALPSGNCSEHGKSKSSDARCMTMQSIPLIRYVLLKLLIRLLTILRYMGAKPPNYKLESVTESLMPDLNRALISKVTLIKNSFSFLYEVINYGKPIRDIVASLFIDEDLYKTLITGEIPEDALNCTALSKLDWRSSKHFESFTNFYFSPTMLPVFSEIAKNFELKTLLHEFMLFFVFSDFETVFMDILTSLMPNKAFAATASKIYFMFYPATVTFLRKVEHVCEVRDEDRKCAHDCCECNLHFSHQILNNLGMVKYLQEEVDLMFILMCSLQYTIICYNTWAPDVEMKMLPEVGIVYDQSSLAEAKHESKNIDSFATLYMIGKDLVQLLKHKEMSSLFFARTDCQKLYIQVLKELHSMTTISMSNIEGFEMETFSKTYLIEYMVSSQTLEQLKNVFPTCSYEQLSFYFNELCSVLEDYLTSDLIRQTNSTTFNLTLERKFFGDPDLYYLRLVLGSLAPDEIIDLFSVYFHVDTCISFHDIGINKKQEVLVEDRDFYEKCEYFSCFKAEYATPPKYLGYNLTMLGADNQSSVNTDDLARIQLNIGLSDETRTNTSYFESAVADIMNLLTFFLINPDVTEIAEEEKFIIKIIHVVQNHPSKLDAIGTSMYGRGHIMTDSERSNLFRVVDEVCKVYLNPSSENNMMGSKKYIVKREYYEKYWCPVLSRYSHYSLSYFTAACKVMEQLDSEKIKDDKVKADLWIPYRIPEFYKYPTYIEGIRSVFYGEKFLILVHSCLALNTEDQLQHTNLQLIVYILTLSAYYLLSAEKFFREDKTQLFFKVYSVSTCKERSQSGSIFSYMANLFVSFAKKRVNPANAFEKVYNGGYSKSRLSGGPVEYIGRFLSLLTKLEPISSVILKNTCELSLNIPVPKAEAFRKAMQLKIMENARKKSESLLKKLEGNVKSTVSFDEDASENTKRSLECPICFNSKDTSEDKVMTLGVLDRICLISSMESPAAFSRSQVNEESVTGQENTTGKCYARLARWQQDIAVEQNSATSYCYIDWRTCNHTYHAKCFIDFSNSKMSLSEAWIFQSSVSCSVCRYSLHSLLPVRLTNPSEDIARKCFTEERQITSNRLLQILSTVLSEVGWKYLDEDKQSYREAYYSRTARLLENGSAKMKPKTYATRIDRIRQQLEILSKLKVKGWEKLKVGSKEGLLKHLIPVLMCQLTQRAIRSMEETVRDLLQPQGENVVNIMSENINGYIFETDASPKVIVEDSVRTTALSPEDMKTLEELQEYGFRMSNNPNNFDFKSTEHLIKRDLINIFILIVTAIYESNLLEADKIAIIQILYSRLIGVYLMKTLVLLLPCITEKCAGSILKYEGSGLEALCKAVYIIRLETRANPQIDFFDDETGLDFTSLIEHTTQSVAYFIQIVQTFLSDLSVLNIDCTLEALCKFYKKDDISEFVPNGTFVHNWLTDLDGAIGYHKYYQVSLHFIKEVRGFLGV
ncbi:unnamed protein product [Auanema sp. JU1783]|nr:unnamed protein product [Auanema sp. JU1783]